VTVAKTESLTEENVVSLYGMLASGYERNAVWCMNKATFFTDFFPLMNKSKNNLIEFAGGKYYIMGAEVYFTGSLAAHEAYYGDFEYIIGNYSQDITVVRSEHSGLQPTALITSARASLIASRLPDSVHSCILRKQRRNAEG
jgi:HK97 family phage major capsid protein